MKYIIVQAYNMVVKHFKTILIDWFDKQIIIIIIIIIESCGSRTNI